MLPEIPASYFAGRVSVSCSLPPCGGGLGRGVRRVSRRAPGGVLEVINRYSAPTPGDSASMLITPKPAFDEVGIESAQAVLGFQFAEKVLWIQPPQAILGFQYAKKVFGLDHSQ